MQLAATGQPPRLDERIQAALAAVDSASRESSAERKAGHSSWNRVQCQVRKREVRNAVVEPWARACTLSRSAREATRWLTGGQGEYIGKLRRWRDRICKHENVCYATNKFVQGCTT